MWRVPLFKPDLDDRERKAVEEVLRDGWLSMGERTDAFERGFADSLGHGAGAVTVSNGTAALHLALLALGIGPGDEVIVPSLTFIADLNVVRMVGARPVLADCTSLQDWNMDPSDIRRRIGARTRAVMIVHYAGFPCDMDAICKTCREARIALIEDCAHAVGAGYQGKQCGTFGEVGCFSFFANKNLAVGEGGMLVSTREEILHSARLLRSHGMTSLSLDRYNGRSFSYDVTMPGLNYRMDEIRSAIGIVQLEKLRGGNDRRAEIWNLYRRLLGERR